MHFLKTIIAINAILLISFVSFSQKKSENNKAYLEFIENKGQFHPNCFYKTEISNGAIFFEKDRITYNLYRRSDFLTAKHYCNSGLKKEERKKGIAHYHAYQCKFLNSSSSTTMLAKEQTLDYNNYFIGNDPALWATNVRKYKVLEYKNIYNNIDLRIYSIGFNIKFDYVIYPGGDVSDIQLQYEGQDDIYIENDNLIINTTVSTISESKPISYQIKSNDTVYIQCKYKLKKGNIVSFEINDYDRSIPLIIDPTLIFSTYTGSTVDNWGFTATFDRYGNGFSGGIVNGVGYPVSLGAYQVNFGGGEPGPGGWYAMGWDCGIIKYNSTGTQRLWATYLGGNSSDMPHSLVINEYNDLIILGTTGSSNFPTTTDAYDRTFNGGHHIYYDNVITFGNGVDIFVTRLNSAGNQLIGSTYIGGSDNDGLNFREYYENNIMNGNDSLYYNYADGARGEVITDNLNNIYVGTCTFSSDFPVTTSAFQPTWGGKQDGVVFKFDAGLTSLVWSSYIGGSDDDAVYSIDVNSVYDLYVCGGTVSSNFPVTPGAYKTSYMGKVDAFVSHISRSGNQLLHSTFYGSSQYDQSYFIRTDKNDMVYIFGQTRAPGSTLIHNALYSRPNSGQFIAEFTPDLSTLVWSTVFGSGNGIPNITPTAFAVDICNRIYVAGSGRDWTGNPNLGTNGMQVTIDAYQSTTDGQDFYLMVIRDDASTLDYATFFGENRAYGCGSDHVDGGTSRFDKKGNIYQSVCASCGGCDNFPVTPGAWSSVNNATNCNNALFKFKIFYDFSIADFEVPGVVCAPATIQPINYSMGTNYTWDWGDGSPVSHDSLPSHTYNSPGTYNITLIVSTPWSCNIADTVVKTIQVLGNTSFTLPSVTICPGEIIQIGLPPSADTSIHYTWIPTTYLSNPHVSNPFANPDTTITYTLLVFNGVCTDTIRQTVHVNDIKFNNTNRYICKGESITISANSSAPFEEYVWSYSPNFTDTINANLHSSQITISPLNTTTVWVKGKSDYCVDIDSIKIFVSQLQVDVVDSTLISCHNECDGGIKVALTAGIGQTVYSWNNGSTNLELDNLCSGTYIFTASDSLGCFSRITYVLNNPEKLELNVVSTQNTICSINCIGEAIVSATGGTPQYSYLWPGGDNDSIASGLCGGYYIVTVTDAHSCKDTVVVHISDSSTLNAYISYKRDVLCHGECNGIAQVMPEFGTPPYTFIWSNGSTSQTVNSLCPGNYYVRVIDSDSCIRTLYFNISEPLPLLTTIDTIKNTSCHQICDGYVSLSVSGGTPPYNYNWSNNFSSNEINSLCAGTYYLTITDKNYCKTYDTIIIEEPTPIVVEGYSVPVICNGVCNGKVSVSATGSVPPYSYLWNNGMTTNVIENVCEGTYVVTVTDKNNCKKTTTIYTGNQFYKPPLNAWVDKDTLYPGQYTQLHATQNPHYTYTWTPSTYLNNPSISDPIATPLSNIQYTVTIKDSMGCTNKANVSIYMSDVICDEPIIYVPNAFTPNKDGKNDILYVRGPVIEELYFTIYNRWGQMVFETTDINKGWDGTFEGRESDPGVFVYYLRAKCFGGKEYFKKGNITLLR